MFGENNPEARRARLSLSRYIVTVTTAKHRFFQFLASSILPEDALIVISSDQPQVLSVLSSRLHTCWAMATGGWLGVGNDSRYRKSHSLISASGLTPSARSGWWRIRTLP
jgi:hypothetical protein